MGNDDHQLDSLQYALNNDNEALQKVLEQYQRAQQVKRDLSVLIGEIQDNKIQMEEALADLDKLLDKLKSIKYDRGSIVYHKQYGACIVMGINYNHDYTDAENAILVKIAHMDGINSVPYTEIVPKSELTEAMYE